GKRIFLAVEAGLLSTDAMFVDPGGEVIARARGPGSSPRRVGPQGTVDEIERLYRGMLKAARLPEEQIAERIGVFVSGVDLPDERIELRSAVQVRFPASDL